MILPAEVGKKWLGYVTRHFGFTRSVCEIAGKMTAAFIGEKTMGRSRVEIINFCIYTCLGVTLGCFKKYKL